MKRRSALSISSERPMKRQKSQLAVTQTIVRKELAKKADWKYADVSFAAVNVLNTSTITSVFANILRSDQGLNGFEGNYINPSALLIKYYLHTSQVRNAVRVMAFQWFNTTTPALADVLETTAAGVATVSPINVKNKMYIKVLYDQSHQFAPTAASGSSVINGEGLVTHQTVYIPGKRLRRIRMDPTANTIQMGNLYLLFVSDDTIVPAPQITCYSRCTFTDN